MILDEEYPNYKDKYIKNKRMTLDEEYQKCKEENKNKFRLVHVEDKDYEYKIEYLDSKFQKWRYYDSIYIIKNVELLIYYFVGVTPTKNKQKESLSIK